MLKHFSIDYICRKIKWASLECTMLHILGNTKEHRLDKNLARDGEVGVWLSHSWSDKINFQVPLNSEVLLCYTITFMLFSHHIFFENTSFTDKTYIVYIFSIFVLSLIPYLHSLSHTRTFLLNHLKVSYHDTSPLYKDCPITPACIS